MTEKSTKRLSGSQSLSLTSDGIAKVWHGLESDPLTTGQYRPRFQAVFVVQ